MDKHWFWHSWMIDRLEKGLLSLTHWIWAKRHIEMDTNSVLVGVVAAPEAPAKVAAKTTRAPAKKTTTAPSKRVPKGGEWSVK